MAKQLNVNLAFTADTGKVKTQLIDLQKQLTNLINSANSNNGALGLTKEIQQASAAVATLKTQLKEATNIDTGKLDLGKFNQSLQQSGMSIQAYSKHLSNLGAEGTQAFSALAQSITMAEMPLRRSSTLLQEFGTTLKNTARWQISSSILHGFMGSLQSAFYYAKDLNESLNNIRIVTGYNTDQMARFAQEANKAAQALSTTTTEYTNASLIYYQQGLSDDEVKKRTDVTVKMANVTRESAEEVSQQMTAVWNNFYDGSKSLEYYSDAMTALGAATASSSAEIAEGLEKFAAVADTVGLSYEYATAALATVTATTRQSADVVGNAFKTLFARLEGLKLGDTLDDGTDLNKYSKALDAVGVSIKNTDGDLKEMDQILDELGAKWQTLSNSQQVALAQTVAGVRQYTQLIALMNNWDFFQENVEIASNSEGTLQKQADIYAESWEAASDRVRAAAENLYNQLLNDDFFIQLNNSLADALKFVSNLVESFGGLRGVLLTIGAILTNVFKTQIAEGLQNVVYSLQMMTERGRQSVAALREDVNKQLSQMFTDEATPIGEQIGKIYASQANAQQTVLDNAKNMTEQQQKIAQLLLDQHNLLVQNAIEQGKIAEKAEDEANAITRRQKISANRSALEDSKKAKTLTPQGQVVYEKQLRNENQKAIKDYQTLTKQAGNYETVITKVFGATTVKNIGQVRNIMQQLIKTYDQNATSIKDVKANLTEAYGETGYNALKKFDDEISQENADIEIVEEGIIGLVESIDNLKIEAEQAGEKVSGMITPQDTEALNQLGVQMGNLTVSTMEVSNSADSMGDKLKQIPIAVSSGIDVITTFGQTVMTASMAINSIVGLIDTWNNEDLSGGEKLLATMTTLGMVIPMVTSTLKAYSGTQFAVNESSLLATYLNSGLATSFFGVKVAEDAATEGAITFETAAAPLLAIFVPLVAIIAALVAVCYGLSVAFEAIHAASPEGQLEAAKEAASDLSDALDSAKQQATELADAFDNYTSAVETLEECTRGTEEWRTALSNVNDEVINILDKYPDLAKLNDLVTRDKQTGQLKIDEDLMQQEIDALNEKIDNLQIANLMAQQQVEEKQLAVRTNNFKYEATLSNIYTGEEGIELPQGQILDEVAKHASELVDLTDAEFKKEVNKIAEDLGITFGNLGEDLLEFKDDLSDLGKETLAVETSMKNLNLVSANKALADKGYSDTVIEMAANSFDDLVKEAKDNLEKQGWGTKGISKATGVNEEAEKVFAKYAEAIGLQGAKLKDTTGTDAKREFVYEDLSGEEKTVSLEAMRIEVATAQAMEDLGSSAREASETLKKLQYQPEEIAKGIESFISGHNFNNMTRGEVNKLQSAVNESGGVEEYLKNIFKTDDLKKLAEQFGFESQEALIEGFSQGFEDYSHAIDDIQKQMLYSTRDAFRSLEQEGAFKDLTVNAQKVIADVLDNAFVNGGLEGLQSMQTLMAQLNPKELEDFVNVTQNIDWNTTSVEDFRKELKEAGIVTDFTDEALEELISTMREAPSIIEDATERYKALHEVINDLENGATITQEQYDALGGDIYESFFLKMADGTYKLTTDAKTFYDVVNEQSIDSFKQNIELISDVLNEVRPSQIASELTALGEGGNVNLLNRPSVNNGSDFQKGGWGYQEGTATVVSSTFSNKEGTKAINFTPIMTDPKTGEYLGVFSKKEFDKYCEDVVAGGDDYLHLQIGAEFEGKDAIDQAVAAAEKIHELHEETLDLAGQINLKDDNLTTSAFNELKYATSESGYGRTSTYADYDEAKLEEQLKLLQMVNTEKSKLAEWGDLINSGNATAETFEEIANAVNSIDKETLEALREDNYEQLASTAKSLSELHDMLDENAISVEAFTKAALAMDAATDTKNLNTEELEQYSRYLEIAAENMEGFNKEMSRTEARIVAKGIMKMNDAIDALANNWENWSSILKDSENTSEEYAAAMMGMIDCVANLLDISNEYVSSDFVLEHLTEIEEASKGSAEAIDLLKEALASSVANNLAQTLAASKSEAEALENELNALIESANQFDDLDVGTTIYLEGKDGFVQALNEMVMATGMTVDQINALCDSMGFEANFASEPQKVVTKIPEYTTHHEPVAEHKEGEAWDEVTWTEQTGEHVATGEAAAYAFTTDGSVPKVKSITKKATGSANDYSSSNKGGTKGPGGKSVKGAKKGKDADKKDKIDDKADRYYDINNAISKINQELERQEQLEKKISTYQDHYAGKTLIKSLQKQNALLKEKNGILDKQYENYKKLYEIQSQELGELKGKIGGNWNGNELQNYAELFQANVDKYNAVIDTYNKMSAEQQEKSGKQMVEDAKKSYDAYKDALDRYQKLYYNEMYDTENKLAEYRQQQLENQFKIIENNLKAWETEIQLKLDMTGLKRDWKAFMKDVETDFRKIYKNLTKASGFDVDIFGTHIEDAETRIKQIEDVEAEIRKMEASKDANGAVQITDDMMFGSISEAQEKLKELQKELVDVGNSLNDMYKQVWDNYIDGLEQAKDNFEDINNEIEHLTKELEYEKELIELIYGDKAYELMDKYYTTQQKNIENQIGSIRQQAQFWEEQFEKAFEMNKDKHNVNKDDMSTWTEDMRKAYDNMIEAQEKLNDLVIEGIKNLKDEYLNNVAKTMSEMDKAMWGMDFDKVKEDWDFIQKRADEYLDDVEGAYKIQTLQNKINKSIAETTDLKAQQKLAKLREDEMKMLREKERLTQDDIDLAEARYQIALKEIALEDAQNNKTSMKLSRDTSGNWTYQYVADEEDTQNKQQELLDAYANLYETADNAYNHAMELAMQMYEEYQEKFRQISEDTTLSEEEKYQKLMELQNLYLPEIEAAFENSQLYQQETIYATAGVFAEVCEQDETAYNTLTDAQQALVDAVRDHHLEDYEEIRAAIVDGTYPELKQAAEETFLETNENSHTAAAQVIDDWDKGGDSVKAALNDAFKAVVGYTKDFEKELELLEQISGKTITDPNGVVSDIEAIGDKIDETAQKTDDMADRATSDLDLLRDYVSDVESAWEDMISRIEQAIEALQEYLQATEEAIDAQRELAQATAEARAAGADSPSISGGGGSGGGDDSGGGRGVDGEKRTQNDRNYITKIWRDENNGYGPYTLMVRSSSGAEKGIYTAYDLNSYNQNKADVLRKYGYYVGGPASFKTGGYTGDWDNQTGKMAVLHQKELVLNASDTENMLSAINTIRDISGLNDSISQTIASSIGSLIVKAISAGGVSNINTNTSNDNSNNNTFNITAEFPNANDVQTIRDAILSLPNIASQYVHMN